MIQLQNYINGKMCPPAGGTYIDNVNPATGEVYAKIPNSSEADVNNAVLAAQAAFDKWSNMAAKKT